MIEPTEEEKKNGWTAKTLTEYLKERGQAQAEAILRKPVDLPKTANSWWNPFKIWR